MSTLIIDIKNGFVQESWFETDFHGWEGQKTSRVEIPKGAARLDFMSHIISCLKHRSKPSQSQGKYDDVWFLCK